MAEFAHFCANSAIATFALVAKLCKFHICNIFAQGKFDANSFFVLCKGIVERAPEVPSNKEFYIPHKAVVKESTESTKTRIVYDASAKASADAPSLNECLNPGPSPQNKLWDVLVQQRAYPVIVTTDIRKAFLQIPIRESERDCLRIQLAERTTLRDRSTTFHKGIVWANLVTFPTRRSPRVPF